MRAQSYRPVLWALVLLAAALSVGAFAQSQTYTPNTLVIPMDTTYQDNGIFKAYGLVYLLLQHNIPVDWAIQDPKNYGDVDFTAPSVRTVTASGFGATVFSASYRGGPFVVDSAYYDAALPLVQAWIGTYPSVAVHRAEASFTANLSRRLYAAPTLAVFLDGNEVIAFTYLNAASIPMSDGRSWPTANSPTPAQCPSPNCLSESQIAGTIGVTPDGALLDAHGNPTVCQIMSMHYAPSNTDLANEVAREIRAFLTGRDVHAFFECEAVNWFESLSTAGPFLTTQGLVKANKPASVDYLNSARPFAQAHGTFGTQGGSMPAFALKTGSAYYSTIAVMVKKAGAAVGTTDVWITDHLDGNPANGKISYLGGHQYGTALPISGNPGSLGTRYFLNSLFEAPCSSEAVSTVALTLGGPATTTSPRVTYTLHYDVSGGWAQETTLTLPLPAGASFVSASGGGTFSGGQVTWNLGLLGEGSSGDLTVEVDLSTDGTYDFTGHSSWKVGTTPFAGDSNTVSTLLDRGAPAPPVIVTPADGSTTTDTTPPFTGTAEADATVLLYLDGSGSPIAVTADGSGSWSYTPPSPLAYGPHTVYAVARDGAGNLSGPSATHTFTVVHEPPVVAGPIVASPLGNTLSGTSTSPAGTVITVYVNGTPAGTTTVQAGGTWSLPGVLGLHGGEAVTAEAGTGSARSGLSNTVLVTPAPPVVSSPLFSGATSVSGTSTAPAGSTVTVTRNGSFLGTAVVGAGGSWTLSGLSEALAEGDILAATVTTAGLVSSPSAEVAVGAGSSDLTPAPWVTSPLYAGAVRVSGRSVSPAGTRIDVFVDGVFVGSTTVGVGGTWTFNLPSGSSLRDGQVVTATATDTANGLGTSAPSPQVVVSADAADRTPSPLITSPVYGGATSLAGTSSSPEGTRIDVYAGGVFLGTTTVQAGGTWSLSGIGPLAEGTVLQATATDEGGGHGTSAPSAPVTVLAPPSVPPIVTASLLAGPSQTIFGSSVEAPGSTITVYVNGLSAGTATVNADGSWSLPGVSLAAGQQVTATVEAPGKAVSGMGNTVVVSADAPSVTPPPVVGVPIAADATTVSGTSLPGAAVDVYADGLFLGTVIADGSGNWSLTGIGPLSDGTIVSATATLAPSGTSDWSAPVVVGTAIHLLRSDALTSLTQDRRPLFAHAIATPPYPSLEAIGPNHAFNPGEGTDGFQPSAPGSADDDKGYLRNVTTGTLDPDATVLTDNGRPLVFYELLDNNQKTLKLEKAGSSIRIRIE